MGIGAGSAPRGSRNEAVRPDVLLVDDFDTDEDCRNPVTLDKKWDWWEKALYPTRSVSESTLVVFCGNIIAKDCCVARAGTIADSWDIVNIRDRDGHSTWPQKNTEDDLEKISIDIEGGTFNATNGGTAVIYSEDKTAFISGGTFNTEPDESYIAADHHVVQSGSNWTVLAD